MYVFLVFHCKGFGIYFVIKFSACLRVFGEGALGMHPLVLKVIPLQKMVFFLYTNLIVVPNRPRSKVISF